MSKKATLFIIALALCLFLCGCCDHDFKLLESRKATCREEGMESYYCTKCDTTKVLYLRKLAHVYKKTEPEAGVALFTCVVCGDSYTEEIETNATEPEATKATEATQPQNAEAWGAADNGHSYKLYNTQDPTCTDQGFNTWHCDHCGDVKLQTLAAKGHSYSGKEILAPGCVLPGKRLFTCTVCSHSYEESIDSLGHDYSLVQVVKDATCTTTGMQMLTCSRCAASCKKEMAALGHVKTAATCEGAAGCQRCSAQLAPPLGHAPQNGICGRCGKTLSDSDLERRLEEENHRHALAVETICNEIELEILTNTEAIEILLLQCDVRQLLSRKEYETRAGELVIQIASLEEQFYSARDSEEQQSLQKQLEALTKEQETVLLCLYAVQLQEENAALEETRAQRLAEEDRIHRENLKTIREE